MAGWRGNGDGEFKGARAPTRWTADEGVRWSAAISGRTNATPLVVAGRVFTMEEPGWLVAFDAQTGKELWRRAHEVVDFLPPEEAARLRPTLAEATGKEEQLEALRKQIGHLKQLVRRGAPEGRAAAKTALAGIEAVANELRKSLDGLEPYRNSAARGVVGYTSPTPVSDGTRIYTLISNGVVAAYSMEGKLEWGRWLGVHRTEMEGFHSGQAASLRLVDGLLIVPYADLLALDPGTGRQRWSAKAYSHFAAPAPMHLGGHWLLVMPDGQVRRADDGKELRRPQKSMYFVSPVASGDRLYYAATSPTGPGGANVASFRAERLRFEGPAALTSELIWERTVPDATEIYAHALITDGLMYVVSQGAFRALDAATGETVYQVDIPVTRDRVLASPMATATAIYVVGADGRTVVIARGREYREIAVNPLGDECWSTPVVADGHIYIRTFEHLWCIGP
ncbi:MAG: PQQ-binding-like beta-propeller repeat protein [Deltaproteobacteria bacterium]|nr:PQQ-binding-like beta-propeller repeat protein [Deltaproteobacteria bacterium]